MFDLVALDMAGTTVQEHGLVYTALAQATGADDVSAWMGADKRDAIRALLGDEPSDAEVHRAFLDFRERLDAAYRRQPPEPIDGVPELFAELHTRGVKIALTTGFDRATTEALLAVLSWTSGVVDAVVCADDVPQGRPAPYMIFRAMERTGVHDVARVLVGGDTVLDLQAGANAGVGAVVGVLTGGVPAATLAAHHHTHLLDSVADLAALPTARAQQRPRPSATRRAAGP